MILESSVLSRPGAHFKVGPGSGFISRCSDITSQFSKNITYEFQIKKYTLFENGDVLKFQKCQFSKNKSPYGSLPHRGYLSEFTSRVEKKVQKWYMAILILHNSTFESVTFDDNRIFNTVVTWSTFQRAIPGLKLLLNVEIWIYTFIFLNLEV